jgi:hypothetical protein
MLLKDVLSAIVQRCSRALTQCTDKEGTEIRRRLRDLLELQKSSKTSPAEVPVKTT